ncbi:unnamed protein product [Thlaspi arvense]|uniref:AIG1-type G domain-containing protein n=1 Tax=Thlaspi arvense TaxID=13288 RepID=A0AAU9SQ61_THLAR|nr:unnamed protein product [Thlaspi arvense]
MGGGQGADYFLTDPTEVSVVSESSPEDGSILEIACDLGLQQKPTRTLVLVGRSGNGKSATGNSILGRKAFKSSRCASGVTTACELQSTTLPNGQILNVIDTPDALEDDSDTSTLEEYLKDSPDFNEILEACNDRKVLFGNRANAHESQKAKQVQDLLNYVDEIAMKNGKPYMDDLSHEFRESETDNVGKKSWFKHEIVQMMTREKSVEQQQLRQMMERVETNMKETLNRLEKQLNEEQAARLELEKIANEVQERSSDEIKKLREDLDRAKKISKDLEEKKAGTCVIL